MTARRRLAGLLALAVAAAPAVLEAHPLHTTITELTEQRGAGTVRAVVRAFADDFGTAVGRAARGASAPGGPTDATAFAYVRARFGIVGADGRAIETRSCGVRRASGLVWICLEASAPAGLAPLAVRNAVMSELFEDQVNVVQAVVAGARRSLLFTRGDGAKTLR